MNRDRQVCARWVFALRLRALGQRAQQIVDAARIGGRTGVSSKEKALSGAIDKARQTLGYPKDRQYVWA
jgi:transcriptional regulator